MREIRTLRSTWRGLETWHGRDAVTLATERASEQVNTNFDLNRRASPRPYRRAATGDGTMTWIEAPAMPATAAPHRLLATAPVVDSTRHALVVSPPRLKARETQSPVQNWRSQPVFLLQSGSNSAETLSRPKAYG